MEIAFIVIGTFVSSAFITLMIVMIHAFILKRIQRRRLSRMALADRQKIQDIRIHAEAREVMDSIRRIKGVK